MTFSAFQPPMNERSPSAANSFATAQRKRLEEFQRLVRHYIIQIRFGCCESNCTTPTCYSFRRRLGSVPIRRPTTLTARTQAFLLASEDNPHSGLCTNPLFLPLEATELGLEPFWGDLEKKWEEQQLVPPEQPVRGVSNAPHCPEGPTPVPEAVNKDVHHPPITDERRQNVPSVAQKDRRSLTQNLFDTRAVKGLEWKSMGTPVEILKVLSTQEINGQQAFSSAQAVPISVSSDDAKKQLRFLEVGIETDAEHPKTLGAHATGDPQAGADQLDSKERNDGNLRHAPNSALLPDNSTSRQAIPPARDQSTPSAREVLLELSQFNMLYLRHAVSHAVLESGTVDAVELDHDYTFKHRFLKACQTYHALPPNFEVPSLPPVSSILTFAKQTIMYHFSDPVRLAQCFKDTGHSHQPQHRDNGTRSLTLLQRVVSRASCPELPETRTTKLVLDVFNGWQSLVGPLILETIWHSLEALFTPPPEIVHTRSPRLKPQTSSHAEFSYVLDEDAAHMLSVAILSLAGSVDAPKQSRTLQNVQYLRASGCILPDPRQHGYSDPLEDPWLKVSDALEFEPAIRLAIRVVRAIAARRSFWLIAHAMHGYDAAPRNERFPLMDSILAARVVKREGVDDVHSTFPCRVFLEFLRTIMIQNWDGKVLVKRWEPFGAALEILADMHQHREALGLSDESFQLPYLSSHLDVERFAVADLSNNSHDNNTLHVYQFTFLFPELILVDYFRIANFTKMAEAYSGPTYHRTLVKKFAFTTEPSVFEFHYPNLPKRWNRRSFIENRLKIALSHYLVLDVRRDHLLEDAFDQLWSREKRELLRPLKLRLGMEEGGEEGIDHGGVSQEFFRVVFEKAFDPDAGLFLTDSETKMSWFQPLSHEPLQTYELLGLLVSLAVYNGVTLPMTFPLIMYQKLLARPGEEPTTDIEDGWPALAKAFGLLLEWSEGEVADVYTREYAFDFEAYGQKHAIDMLSVNRADLWPLTRDGEANTHFGEASELQLVTNANRERYVTDYIYWLTHKSVTPQYTAFARGFHTCLDRAALALLPPKLLRTLVEGTRHVDVAGLKSCADYEDGYTKDSPVIQWFWSLVETFNDEKRRRLLEFVTASDRIPVQGWKGITFCIVRRGADTEHLPTSATCFGKLMLPEYVNKEKMRVKLDFALDHTKGFGNQ